MSLIATTPGLSASFFSALAIGSSFLPQPVISVAAAAQSATQEI
jgi:hypothetical protein